MERLVTVKDISERYGCTLATARRYIRRMFHYEDPLAAPMWAFNEWEKSRERMPEQMSRELKAVILQRQNNNGRVIVPRKREG